MRINNTPYTSIWYNQKTDTIQYIDQTALPWELKIKELKTLEDAIRAINDMEVRGAPLIGVTAAFGYYLGVREIKNKAYGSKSKFKVKEKDLKAKDEVYDLLLNTRPTAINLKWALDQMQSQFSIESPPNTPKYTSEQSERELTKTKTLLKKALLIRQEEIARSKAIASHGLKLIKEVHAKTKKPVNILTHCNAGWLACVDYGTATAPIYMAHDEGIPVHVWVDETRPRNQGARLTAYELSEHGVPCTVIPDNTGGHLMQNGLVDMVIVGTDRVAANGDVANKIGTYLKALAAKDNGVPFYVAMPTSTFDKNTKTGSDIPIEERSGDEVRIMDGKQIIPNSYPVANYAFDITPANLVTAYITENGRIDKIKALSSTPGNL